MTVMAIRFSPLFFFTTLALTPFTQTCASDLVRIGAGARSLGMGNVAGLAKDPLAAITANPAFLSGQDKSFQVSMQTLWVDSEFRSALGDTASADRGPGIIPDIAFVWPLANSRWTLGGGISVQSGMLASFDYVDPPGTLGVSYGFQTHESSYAVVNTTAAAAYQVNDKLSVGVQLGIAYNRDQLNSPYIFQSHPGLQSLKVLVDLDADDYTPTLAMGLDYQTDNDGRVYFSFSPESEFDATGDTSGDLSQLGLFNQGDFAYDVAVQTARPAYASTGYTWPVSNDLTMGVQLDWIGWEDAFDNLPILLTNGTNGELNAFLGSTSIADTVPLDWDNQLTFHIGGELTRGDRTYRLGYEYSDLPVPTSTMTPLTGAILRHGVSAGLTMPLNGYALDLAYRASFGADTTIEASALKGTEYPGTRLNLMLHSIGIAIQF